MFTEYKTRAYSEIYVPKCLVDLSLNSRVIQNIVKLTFNYYLAFKGCYIHIGILTRDFSQVRFEFKPRESQRLPLN